MSTPRCTHSREHPGIVHKVEEMRRRIYTAQEEETDSLHPFVDSSRYAFILGLGWVRSSRILWLAWTNLSKNSYHSWNTSREEICQSTYAFLKRTVPCRRWKGSSKTYRITCSDSRKAISAMLNTILRVNKRVNRMLDCTIHTGIYSSDTQIMRWLHYGEVQREMITS